MTDFDMESSDSDNYMDSDEEVMQFTDLHY